MSDVKSIVTRLGRRRIAERIGVSVSAVGNAVVDGRFPANWYGAMKEMCDAEGADCPLSIFAMKGIEQQAGAA